MDWIYDIYRLLAKSKGTMNWWPANSAFEVIVGAILTQNTNWGNVEKSILELKKHNYLDPGKMHSIKTEKLAAMIRSSGYYNQKALKLKAFLDWYKTFQYSKQRIQSDFSLPDQQKELRNLLLQIFGIGPETADSILCYAFEMPFFVVDTYTMRIFSRYTSSEMTLKYYPVQSMVENTFKKKYDLSELPGHYNEFHALIVWLGSQHCKKRNPGCMDCPLNRTCKKKIL